MKRGGSWPRRSGRRAVVSALLVLGPLGCASTQLKPDDDHPASATAESLAPTPVGGALAADFDPVPSRATESGGSAGSSAHDHSGHAAAQAAEEPPGTGTADEAEKPAPNPDEASSKWTCTMHPEIIRDKPGNCPICGMKLVPVQPKGSSGAKP